MSAKTLHYTTIIAIICSIILASCLEFGAWPPHHFPQISGFLFTALFTISCLLIIYGIFKRFIFSWIITLLILVPVAVSNFIKYKFLEIPVLGSDGTVIYEGFHIWQKMLSVTDIILFIIGFISILGFFVYLWKCFPKRNLSKLKAGLLISTGALYLVITCTYFAIYTTHDHNRGVHIEYKTQGFFTAFVSNTINYLLQGEPNSVSHEEADLIYKSFNIQDDQISSTLVKPDIIVVVSESYLNPNTLKDIQYSPKEVTPIFNKLRKNKPLNLYSPVYGGASPAAQFELIGGYPHILFNFQANPPVHFTYNYSIPTLPSYLQDIGYNTITINPFSAEFFNANDTIYNLGFDQFIASNHMKHRMKRNHHYIGDDQIFLEAVDILQESSTKPKLLMLLTMQNHAPYTIDSYGNFPEVEKVTIKKGTVKETIRKTMETFATGIRYSDKSMGDLIKFIDQRKKPTLLVFLPDHFPPLPDNAVHELYQSNKEFNDMNKPSLKKHSVEGFVYANYELQHKVSNNPKSMFYLPSNILSWANLPKNKFFNYLQHIEKDNPIIHNADQQNPSISTSTLEQLKTLTFYNLLTLRDKPIKNPLVKMTIKDYFTESFSSGIFAISISIEASRKLSSTITDMVKKAGGSINELKYFGAYAAVFKNGKLIKEVLNNDGYAKISEVVDGYTIELVSVGGEGKKIYSSLKVNGEEYSTDLFYTKKSLGAVSINNNEIQFASFNTWKYYSPRSTISSVDITKR